MKNIENIEKLLIVVDMVNGFVREGAMADSYIEHTIPKQIELIENVIKAGEGLAFIKDNHEENCIEFKRFPVHCKIGTSEADLVEELKKYESEALVYPKNSTSAMFAENFLFDIDKMINLKTVEIVGCCTDICVINLAIPLKNYFDQKDKDIEIIVYKDAVETYNSDVHPRDEYNEMAFKLLAQTGIKLV